MFDSSKSWIRFINLVFPGKVKIIRKQYQKEQFFIAGNFD